jgi:hypothetical protein
MRDPQRRTIDGVTYECTPLPAGVMLEAFSLLGNIVGPGLGDITSLADLESAVLAALGVTLERLKGRQLVALAELLAKHSRVEKAPGMFVGVGDVFDLHFAGDMDGLISWGRFALEVTFAGFFSKLRERSAARRAASEAVSKSQSISPPG